MGKNTPLLSVLVPSRGRVQDLYNSIKSFGTNPDAEFLIAIDEDDPQLNKYLSLFSNVIKTKRYGYGHLHEYYNLLAKKSKGKWLLLWNDDAQLQSAWDEPLRLLDYNQPYIIEWTTEFPMMSRKMYEIIGHFSMGGLCDRYLRGLAERSKAGVRLSGDVRISHGSPRDATYWDKEASVGTAWEINGFKELEEDVNKIEEWRDKSLITN